MHLYKKLIVICLILLSGFYVHADKYSFTTKSDVYTVGDIHGAFDNLTKTLKTAQLIDDNHQWIGGTAHLVSLGDLLDRGPNSRAVVDLLRQLQLQADTAGGKVHVILGNHEIMNLQGDWRYLSKEEVSAFAGQETKKQRTKAYQIYLRSYMIQSSEKAQKKFDKTYPPGFFAHIKEYHSKGDYGKWLLNQPFIISINNQLYTHGGLSPQLEGMSLEEINETQKRDLTNYLSLWEYYLKQKVLTFNVPFYQRPDFIALTKNSKKKKKFIKGHNSKVFSTNATTWYRGNIYCHPYFEEDRLKAQLKSLSSTRLWVGHTTTTSKKVETRLSEHVINMDTGMLSSYYNGEPWIGRVHNDGTLSFTNGLTGEQGTPLLSPYREYVNPYRMTDAQVEDFLQTAEIIKIEGVNEGKTKPLKLTLKKGKRVISGIFKFKDSHIMAERTPWSNKKNEADRFNHELAAYRLDRLLGIGLVPVTVERTIDGRKGVVQLWLDNLISSLEINEQDIDYYGVCDLGGQMNMLNVFDYLIANRDRNQSNILFSKSDLQIWFIDHSRAFGISSRRDKMIRGEKIKASDRFKRALKALDIEKLQSLKPWLHKKQIEAILVRRDKILEDNF